MLEKAAAGRGGGGGSGGGLGGPSGGMDGGSGRGGRGRGRGVSTRASPAGLAVDPLADAHEGTPRAVAADAGAAAAGSVNAGAAASGPTDAAAPSAQPDAEQATGAAASHDAGPENSADNGDGNESDSEIAPARLRRRPGRAAVKPADIGGGGAADGAAPDGDPASAAAPAASSVFTELVAGHLKAPAAVGAAPPPAADVGEAAQAADGAPAPAANAGMSGSLMSMDSQTGAAIDDAAAAVATPQRSGSGSDIMVDLGSDSQGASQAPNTEQKVRYLPCLQQQRLPHFWPRSLLLNIHALCTFVPSNIILSCSCWTDRFSDEILHRRFPVIVRCVLGCLRPRASPACCWRRPTAVAAPMAPLLVGSATAALR